MTNIEWTDETWNPIIGCSKVSPACDHCYAERMAHRLACNPNTAAYYAIVTYERGGWTGETALINSVLERPLHWRKPRRVFVGSMTDMFHKDTPDEWLDRVFAVMALTPHITYQVLTKRPLRMYEYMYDKPDFTAARKALGLDLEVGLELSAKPWPLPNVWLGVTVENQEYAVRRIPVLLETPAAVRFVSVEPMLGPVKITKFLHHEPLGVVPFVDGQTFGGEFGPALDWIICGGETGPGARPARAEWFYDLKNQCVSSGVPFFFKHWGTPYAAKQRGSGGRVLDGEHWEQFPETCEA